MRKIAYFCNPYPAISHTFIFREIETLRRKGFEIVTASVSRSQDLPIMGDKEKKEAERTYYLRETSPLTWLRSLLMVMVTSPVGFARMLYRVGKVALSGQVRIVKAAGYLAEAILLIPWLKRLGVSHIHEHFANPTALVALLCKSYGGFSYSVSIHGPDIFYTIDSSRLAEKAGGAEFVRCISHYCRSQLMRVLPYNQWDRQHIVRCGVNGRIYTPAVPVARKEPVILCVGRLCPAKGQHLLLKACARLVDRKLKFKIILVGDGPDRMSLEKLTDSLGLRSYVTFTGALGQDEVLEYYRKANLFVLPSFAEGVPVVLMEAMAMELPVVATRITGIPELIEDGSEGVLATPGDMEELSCQIERLLLEPDLCVRLGKAGREKVLARYDQEKNSGELASLFKRYGDENGWF